MRSIYETLTNGHVPWTLSTGVSAGGPAKHKARRSSLRDGRDAMQPDEHVLALSISEFELRSVVGEHPDSTHCPSSASVHFAAKSSRRIGDFWSSAAPHDCFFRSGERDQKMALTPEAHRLVSKGTRSSRLLEVF
ncbi:hypothetical protein SUNI508_03320 [Seiridium unicorne]|uniref:Uncharacterized protein n=1 Tax=Seiridium unicorne TaxID=138068 RepID=A0ABR2VE38_9PEZI